MLVRGATSWLQQRQLLPAAAAAAATTTTTTTTDYYLLLLPVTTTQTTTTTAARVIAASAFDAVTAATERPPLQPQNRVAESPSIAYVIRVEMRSVIMTATVQLPKCMTWLRQSCHSCRLTPVFNL